MDTDPLGLFDDSPPSDPCLGSWKNERLSIVIRRRGDTLLLESNGKELVLQPTKPTDDSEGANPGTATHEYTVADAATPDSHVYICRVMGTGRDTRLTLEPPRQKGGSFKAILKRVEHLTSGPEPTSTQKMLTSGGPTSPRDEPRRIVGGGSDRRNAPAYSRSRSASAPRGRGRGPRRSRSRSPPRRRSPPRVGKGGGKGDPDEPITTIFLTGLPADATEDEVRDDCERAGEVTRVVLMNRQGEKSAFVRYVTVHDAQRAVDKATEGRMEVCQGRVQAQMARRNTN